MKIIEWDGKPIDKPGIYRGVPIKTYHSGKLCVGPSTSSSGLRTIVGESPAHYWEKSPLNPRGSGEEETDPLVFGRAVHWLMLGEPGFKKEFVIRPETYIARDGTKKPWSGNATSCQEWLALIAQQGLTVLKPADIDAIRGMAVSLANEPVVKAGALNGVVECTIAWQDEETGVWLLARPDVVPTESREIVDLKTTTSVAIRDIVRTMDDYAYHQQGALVAEGYKIVTGESISGFSLYFVEKKPPYCAHIVGVHPDDMARGALMNRLAVRTFAKCYNSKKWPGPNGIQNDAAPIGLSDDARRRIDKRLKDEGLIQ